MKVAVLRLSTLAALSLGTALGAAACSGAAARRTDTPIVKAGLGAWCDTLARVRGESASWDRLAECKSADTASSGAYLELMGRCYERELTRLGKDAPDSQKVLADCSSEVVPSIQLRPGSDSVVVAARCERAERCEKVTKADCLSGIESMSTFSRAAFSAAYNEGALDEIAACLRGSACGDDEDKARARCYDELSPRMLWFP